MRAVARTILSVAIACAATAAVWGFDFEIGAGIAASTETPKPIAPIGSLSVSHQAGGFQAFWSMEAIRDGVYGQMFDFGVTLLIREGGLRWSGGNLALEAGRLVLKDKVQSPYSLFLSGQGNSAVSARIDFEDDHFFFSDVWIDLNHASGTPVASGFEWPNRAAVVKSYGLKFGNLRVGVQDAIVFSSNSSSRAALFDAEYFLVPAPGFFLQYIGRSEDGPWARDPQYNDNTLFGFFADWKRDGLFLRGQVLVDDFNLNRFVNPGGYQNPDKIAWMIGGSIETDYGTFSLDHAGATKYTFQPYGNDTSNAMTGYTFYPDTRFSVGSDTRFLSPEDSYLGYVHGENNIAFMGRWQDTFGGFAVDAALEFMLSGSKSPTNPWGSLLNWRDGGSGTKFLDDSTLEKKIVLSGGISTRLGAFTVYARMSAGAVFNRLTPDAGTVDPINGTPIYSPTAQNALIGSLTLGGKWALTY